MVIYAIDDEPNALEYLCDKIRQAEPDCELHSFTSSTRALESSRTLRFDVAFLDINMPGISGIELAKKLKAVDPRVNLVFVTGYSEYAIDAFSLDAGGYLLKPAAVSDIRHALDNLRYPMRSAPGKLRLQCFGDFEVFLGDEPLKFKYAKTKEMLAYMVDRRGAVCTKNDIIIALWEDDDHAAYYRSLVKDLTDTLSSCGCGDAIDRRRAGLSVIRDKVTCDYYDYLDGVPSAVNLWRGEYMRQYSWAEDTAGALYDI